MKKRYEYLNGYEFSGCYVRSCNIIGFAAQKWQNNDSLEQRDTTVFFYYPDVPHKKPINERWGDKYIGESLGLNVCAAYKPNERWIFVTNDGEVYVGGQGDDGWEKPIAKKKNLYFSNVKSICNGHAVAVGPDRIVYFRKAANNWIQLENGLFPLGEETDLEYAGFNDIDGFSEKDMYACGDRGDLWHYDGTLWIQVDIPTNSMLKNICCADDGYVYITTVRREILKGRGETWNMIQQDLTEEVFEATVCYEGNVIVSTVSELYVVENNKFKVLDLGVPQMNSKAHIASGDGILVVAGKDEATMYDGKSWSVILESMGSV